MIRTLREEERSCNHLNKSNLNKEGKLSSCEDFGYTLIKTSIADDARCRPRKKKIQPSADLQSMVQQSKT